MARVVSEDLQSETGIQPRERSQVSKHTLPVNPYAHQHIICYCKFSSAPEKQACTRQRPKNCHLLFQSPIYNTLATCRLVLRSLSALNPSNHKFRIINLSKVSNPNTLHKYSPVCWSELLFSFHSPLLCCIFLFFHSLGSFTSDQITVDELHRPSA